MQVKTIKGNSAQEIETLLNAATAADLKPTLAIVFLAKEDAVPGVTELLDKNGISIFGVSSFGHFIDKEHDKDSIIMMLMELNTSVFRIECMETGKSSTTEIAAKIGKAGLAAFQKPAFIVASGGIKTNGENIIEGIEEGAGSNVRIFGGLGANDFQTMRTFVFTNGKIVLDGVLSLILDEAKISLESFATGGCDPIGIFHTITKSEGNIVYTIDDQPAFDLVLRYCGKQNETLGQQIDVLNIVRQFQIQLHRENASYVMRTIMYANPEDKSVVFAGSLPQGSKVKFSILPGFEAVDNVVNEFKKFGKNFPDADAMIVFSCQGREIAFGPWVNDEIDRLHKIWNVPMIGLFSFGEIGNGGDGKNEFYNMTCSLAILKENKQ